MSDTKDPDKWSQLPVQMNGQDFKPNFAGGDASSLARIGDHVVRISGDLQDRDLSPKQRINQAHQELVLAKKLFAELEDEYDIRHAGFRPFIANSLDKPRAMVASDYIEGTVLEDEKSIPDLYLQDARTLLQKLTNYLIDKFSKSEPMLTDIFRISQYAFNKETHSFVLIDTDTYADDTIYAKQRASRELREIAHLVLSDQELKEWYAQVEPIDRSESDVILDNDF